MRDGDLRKLFKRYLPQVHFQAVELGAIGSGCPDTNFCHESVEGWLEFKALKKNRVDLSPEQIGWITNRLRHGGLVKIAVRVEEDILVIFDGCMVIELISKSINDNFHHVQAHYSGGPKNWNWPDILNVIKTKVISA